jgi:hypothetical protein
MAPVLAGRSRWSVEEADHLARCPDCGAEWRLLSRAAAIGDRLPSIDPGPVTAGVLKRVAAEPRPAHSNRRRWMIGIAAAVAASLLLVSRIREPSVVGRPPLASGELEIPVLELDSLSADQLQAVLETLEPPLGSESTLDAPTLQDLDDTQLERLLRSLEG